MYKRQIQDNSTGRTPSGTYRLQVSSDAQVSELSQVLSSRCEKFSGDYTPNRMGIVCRCVIAPLSTCSISVRVQLHPAGLAGVLLLEKAAGSTAELGKKGAGNRGKVNLHESFPASAAEQTGTLFSAMVCSQKMIPVIQVPPGRHVLSLTLDRHNGGFDLTSTGHIARAPLSAASTVDLAASHVLLAADLDGSAPVGVLLLFKNVCALL